MADSPINLTTENLFDIMYTMRAMRRLKPDPVPDELVVKILNAAIRAPSGGNNQPWHFVVVKDIAMKKAVQVWYKKALDEIIGPRYATSAPPPGSVSRVVRVGTDGGAAGRAGRSVGRPDPQICFAALRAAGRSVGTSRPWRTRRGPRSPPRSDG